MKKISLLVLLLLAPMFNVTNAAGINQDVARAYNEGVVRCSNEECAKYLFACFRSYSESTLQVFLACGTQASRLNDDQRVVFAPQG